MHDFLFAFGLVGLPSRMEPRPLADRMGWTVTWLGALLTVSTAIFFATQEGDRPFRTWATIRRQSRIFLAVSLTPLAGPLTAFIMSRRGHAKKLIDPLEAAVGPSDLE